MDNLTAPPLERAYDANFHETMRDSAEEDSAIPSPKLLIPCASMFVALLALMVSRSLSTSPSVAGATQATSAERLETVQQPSEPTAPAESAPAARENEARSESKPAIVADKPEQRTTDSDQVGQQAETAAPKPRIVRPGQMSLEQELAFRREREAAGERWRARHRGATRRETADSRPESVSENGAPPTASKVSSAGAGAATLAHWNRMNDVIDQEAAMRQPPSEGITASNATDFLTRRIDAGHFAARELRSLPTEQVDPAVLQLNSRLAAWYERGAQVSTTGRRLLGASETARRGPEGKAWQAADKAHQAEVQQLNNDAGQIQRTMQSRYRTPFPALK